MKMRAVLLTIATLLIFVLIIFFYRSFFKPDPITPILPSLKVIGVVDLNNDRKIDLAHLRSGDDILIVLDSNGFMNQFVPTHPQLKAIFQKPFDLVNYGDSDGLIDSQSAIWPYLHVIVYRDNGTTYQVRHLDDAGIRAIASRHLTPEGNHSVIFSDGDTRTLFEIKS